MLVTRNYLYSLSSLAMPPPSEVSAEDVERRLKVIAGVAKYIDRDGNESC